MISPPSLRMAAYLVNAAHAQLSHAQRALSAALQARAEQPGRKPGECGTAAGYRRHQRSGTVPCFACIEGKSWDERRRRRAA